MIALTTLPFFLLACWILNITPGPDMLYVIACSVSQGRHAGLVSALGIAAGSLMQIGIVALGLASILAMVPLAYDLITWVGAGYLMYLGIRVLLRHQHCLSAFSVERTGLWRIFTQGVVTNVLNPKVTLFYVAFLPQFASPASGSVPLQIIMLGILCTISGTVVNILVSLFASLLGNWFKRQTQTAKILNWLAGSIFIGLGVRLAFLQRK